MTVDDPTQSNALAGDATSDDEQDRLIPNGNLDNGSIESQGYRNNNEGTMAVPVDNEHHAPFVKARSVSYTHLRIQRRTQTVTKRRKIVVLNDTLPRLRRLCSH